MKDTVGVVIRVRCFARQEGSLWVSCCPGLDVYSQGDDREEARKNLHEAVELWLDSCVERGTLGEALRELGWHKVPPGDPVPEGEDQIQILAMAEDEQVLGEPFSLDLQIPAYQAAMFGQHSAPC
jgi:predicted RNase H-like HicB family nuclease